MHRKVRISLLLAIIVGFTSISAFGQGQYKHIGLRGISEIVAGDTEAAIERFTKHLETSPTDAESKFGLALALAKTGDTKKGVQIALDALKDGLPPGRFVAGPRELVEPLRTHKEFLNAIAQAEKGLVGGPLIGNVTAESASLWMRFGPSAQGGTVRIKSPDGKYRVSKAFDAPTKNDDFVVKVLLDDLRPSTVLTYEVVVGDHVLATSHFKTFPADQQPSTFSLAFGGGAGFTPQYERMWTTIEATKPDALLLLGDNVYIDTPKEPLVQKYCYYRRQARSEFRSLVKKTPVFAIWDDHDFGTNDCLGSPQTDDPPWKRPVFELFRQQWVNPGYGGGDKQPGCWFDFVIGDVHFIMLDGRYYRTSPKGDSPTMLGAVQKKWLLETLGSSKGTFKILISPVPWSKGTKPGSRDTWDGFNAEREEIFDFIKTKEIGGVVLIAADRHRSDCWVTERPDAYPLYEFMSSCLTNMHRHKNMEASLFSYNVKNSFGRLLFDTIAEDPVVRYQIMTIDGELVHNFKLNRSQLGWR